MLWWAVGAPAGCGSRFAVFPNGSCAGGGDGGDGGGDDGGDGGTSLIQFSVFEFPASEKFSGPKLARLHLILRKNL